MDRPVSAYACLINAYRFVIKMGEGGPHSSLVSCGEWGVHGGQLFL